ncbi:5-methylcytosine-specific restriction endonuclease McrA [Alkalibacillus filiformis]|uniref:5-methylcytosine-specific restriction endonuclease McrA n=1 Tax=Alkalibacillus filiformis TaxID=200990 RepID=A0ABU0DQV0_9BACI|nr:hypothetical protein [Alkalibacillus filiformis]MDQ0350709.1 5-methylcytosine-specific restriction endonuclease McrA [Alkalibacillus filiformis]
MREAIKQRDNYKCQECTWLGFVKTGRKKIQLAADHINVLEEYPELALDEGNLETLVERKPTK